MKNTMSNQNIELRFQEGASDKVYQAELIETPDGWLVNFAYGRRGNALTTGTKTKTPVSYDKALAAYEKLVKSKMAKGYKADGVSGSIAVVDKEDTGLRPQLLNETDRDAATFMKDFIFNPDYCMQEKYDGRRRMIKKSRDGVVGANKKGVKVALHPSIEKACHGVIGGSYVMDGEDMGDQIMIFDDLTKPNLHYEERYASLKAKLEYNQHLIPVETAFTTQAKHEMWNRLLKERAEGVVFKLIDAPYSPGRPASGGAQFKCKFYETASCIVSGHHPTKNSISLDVYDDNDLIDVGNVTVYPNQVTPAVGDIVEVKYLYYNPGGSLYQPVLLGVRDDVDMRECLIDKLKAPKHATV